MALAKNFYLKLIKFLICLGIGVVITLIPPPAGLKVASMYFMGIFVTMILVMTLQVLADYVVVTLACTACLAVGVTNFAGAFSGFSTNIVWMVIIIGGFANALTATGLIKRIAYLILKRFPKTYKGQVMSIMAAALVLVPFIPNQPAKVAILGPFAALIAKESNLEQGSKGAAGLFTAMFIPSNILGMAFITGSTMVFMLLGFMPEALSASFSWVQWFLSCVVWFVVHYILTYVFIVKYYQPEDCFKIEEGFADKGLKAMGPMSANEKFGLFVLLASIALWVTADLHQIDIFVITVAAFAVMAAKGLLTPEDFASKTPWIVVVIMGCIISLAALMETTGVNAWLTKVLAPIFGGLVSNVWLLVPMIAALTYLLRYGVISLIASLTIILAVFTPVAASAGIHPFVIIFSTYASTQVWNLAFHNAFYLQAEAMTGGKMITWKSVFPSSVAYMIINLIALLASIPLWIALGYV